MNEQLHPTGKNNGSAKQEASSKPGGAPKLNGSLNGSAGVKGSALLQAACDREQIVPIASRLRKAAGAATVSPATASPATASAAAALPELLPAGTLVERLDPALGEATSGIGALLTELIRRTLRGGVQRIDEELQSQVDEKVDATVTQRIPVIESAAEVKARQVAEQEVKQTATRLDGQLAQTRQELASTNGALAETKTQIAAAQRRLAETEQGLSQKIESSSHRVEKTARDLVREQVDTLTRRSKSTLDALYGRFDSLELQLATLENQFTRMAARVIELERPRGLRRFWKLFSFKRKPDA